MKKKIAVFDIDGTIFRNSLLIELHWKMVKAGIIPRAAITKLDKRYWDWVRRKSAYDDYLNEVIKSFDEFAMGQSVTVVQALARQVVKTQSHIVYRFTRDLTKKLSKTHQLVAISGSPAIIVNEFARIWKFDYVVATEFAVSDRRIIKKLFIPATDKRRALLELCQNQNLSLKNSVGIGDTESDIGIFSLVDKPICFNPTSGLYKIAKRKKWKVVVERKDMIYKINE